MEMKATTPTHTLLNVITNQGCLDFFNNAEFNQWRAEQIPKLTKMQIPTWSLSAVALPNFLWYETQGQNSERETG